jgi:hypothetical protein
MGLYLRHLLKKRREEEKSFFNDNRMERENVGDILAISQMLACIRADSRV